MKRHLLITSLVLFIGLFLGSIHSHAQTSDFDVIYQRMYNKYLGKNPSSKNVDKLIEQLTDEGAFRTIDYTVTTGAPRRHVQNLITLACAYQHPDNAYYHQEQLKEHYLRALRFWVKTNHQAQNWWYRYIPYPKELSVGVVLMNKEIAEDKQLFDDTMNYLRWSYETAAPRFMTGANGADIIMGSLAATVLTRNDAQMKDFQQRMSSLLTIQPSEGIQCDYLFGQHCGNGRQLYFTSYGKEFVNSMLGYLEFCQDTRYESQGLELLQQLFVNGVQWIFYSKQHDPNNAGRFISSNQYAKAVWELAQRVYRLSKGDAKKAMKLAVDRIGGDNTLEGNRMFWRFDYMVNRRKDYLSTTRMTSTRTVGNEAGNGDGNFNYYAANGVNYLMVNGREYDRDFFKIFNNRQYPGITAEQDHEPLPIPDWGEGGGNENAFAGGVSDSLYGACGTILQRRGLTARKAWFYFDKEYVCLGAGIDNPDGKGEVWTTLNQCNRQGKVMYGTKKQTHELPVGDSVYTNVDWIWHSQVAYINLVPDTRYRLKAGEKLFTANVNHGVKPTEGSYAYAVRPATTDVQTARNYAKQLPVDVIANTAKVQAVRHRELQITEVIFYEAGTLKLGKGQTLEVDAPCALLWNEKAQTIHAANPRCESENPATLNVTLRIKGKAHRLTFQLPQEAFAGSTVAQRLN